MASYDTTLAPEPISGDSLTQYLRSVTNSLGVTGQNLQTTGQSGYGMGMSDLSGPANYYKDILSGNKAAMESAIAPEKSDILSQYRARRKQIAATQGRSGGTNEAVANSEFGQARDVAALMQKLRPQAAQGLTQVGTNEASLGLQESELGQKDMFESMMGLLQRRGQNNSNNLTSQAASWLSILV